MEYRTLLVVALAFATSDAFAQDQSPWSGFYAGTYLGGAFGSSKWTDSFDNTGFYNSGSGFAAQAGVMAGAFAGGNYTSREFVLGAEGEIGFFGAGWGDDTSSGFDVVVRGGKHAYSVTEKINEAALARVRARLGYAISDHLLLYTAGGVTLAQAGAAFAGYCCGSVGGSDGNVGPARPIQPTYISASSKKWLNGLNVGVGGEYALASNWVTRAEYIYDGFFKTNFAYDNPPPFPNTVRYAIYHDRRSADLNLNTIRAGIEHKF